MDNFLKILSWNICWECMTEKPPADWASAKALANECAITTTACLTNAVRLIDNDKYDIIGLQEAARYNDIIDKSANLQMMGCIHHAEYTNGNTVDLTTFYNKEQFKVLAVKVGNIGNIKKVNTHGRPYHIIFLQHIRTSDKYIIINLHNGNTYLYTKDHLETILSTDINNLYIVNPSDTRSDFKNIQNETTSDGATLFSNTFYTIVLGDFNDRGENYWKQLQPFKHTTFQNLKSIVVSSIKKPPVTCCTGKDSVRTTGGDMDNLIGDYILIDNNLKYIKNNEIVDYFTQHSAKELSSDHKPVYAIVKMPNAAPVAKKETVEKSDPNIIKYICIPNTNGTHDTLTKCKEDSTHVNPSLLASKYSNISEAEQSSKNRDIITTKYYELLVEKPTSSYEYKYIKYKIKYLTLKNYKHYNKYL